MASAHSRLAVFLGIARGAARPPAQEHEQLLPRTGQVLWMKFSYTVIIRVFVHQIIKAVDQTTYGVFATHQLVSFYQMHATLQIMGSACGFSACAGSSRLPPPRAHALPYVR